MYLLASKAFDSKTTDWRVLACLGEDTIGGYTPLMKNGDGAVPLPNFNPRVALLEIVGTGAFGIVVRAADRAGVHRAVKIFLPPKAMRDLEMATYSRYIPPGMDSSTDYTEITLTNKQPFKNVVAVTHHGDTAGAAPPEGLPANMYVTRGAYSINDREPLPFTVSPLVDGVDLERFFPISTLHSSSHYITTAKLPRPISAPWKLVTPPVKT